MSERENVLIVSVDEYSFEMAKKEGFYAFPCSHNWKVEDKKYIGFYQTRPKSALTHLADIETVNSEANIDGRYKLICFGDRMNEDPVLISFSNFHELESEVPANGTGIQSVKYSDLDKISKADEISDL